jgi:hypothetical protein
VKTLHRSGTAEGELPAERFFTGCQEFAAETKLRGHATRDSWIVPREGHDAQAMRSQ